MAFTLISHDNGTSTYGFDMLNDMQTASICNTFDFLHCAIDEDLQGGKVLLKNGDLVTFKLSLRGVK